MTSVVRSPKEGKRQAAESSGASTSTASKKSRRGETPSEEYELIETIDLQIGTVLDDLVASIEYTGFNPAVLREKIKFEHPQEYKRDVPSLLSLFLQRGSRVSKALGSMSDTGRAKISTLISKYGITDTGNPGRLQITLPRLAAAFPELVAYLLARRPQYLSMQFSAASKSIPAFLKVGSFASLIPTDKSYLATVLRDVHLEMMFEVDEIINGSNANRDKVIMFADIAFNSKMFSLASRTAVLAQLTDYFTCEDGVLSFTEEFETTLLDSGYMSQQMSPEMTTMSITRR